MQPAVAKEVYEIIIIIYLFIDFSLPLSRITSSILESYRMDNVKRVFPLVVIAFED